MITQEELQHLIEQTYKIESNFGELKASYRHLQDTIEKVVEFLPNAIWILENDGKVFLQNSQAKEPMFSDIKLTSVGRNEATYDLNFSMTFVAQKGAYSEE